MHDGEDKHTPVYSASLCSAECLLTRLVLLCAPSRRVRFFPKTLDIDLHSLDVTPALAGLPFHRLPPPLELPRLTPRHVERDVNLLVLCSRLCQSCGDVRNLSYVSTATKRMRGGTSKTCEECLEEVFGSSEYRLRRGALFIYGIVLGRNSIYLLLYRR